MEYRNGVSKRGLTPFFTPAEPAMQNIKQSTSKNIWHDVTVKVYCKNSKGYFDITHFSGSKFPSHVLYVNGSRKKDQAQGQFENLWKASGYKGASFVE
jgi:hypothetical protein